MSIVLVVFPGAPTPCQEAIQAEVELDEQIRRRVTEIVEHLDDKEFQNVLPMLSEEEFQGLPPGGGLDAKYVYFYIFELIIDCEKIV